MAGTELVTLSACQTGAENKRDDGLVMEGMSESVLDKRAKAVISTLWEVNDQSTAAIMADFYKLWVQSGGKLTKAEALRQAQLNLLHASVKPKDDATGRGAKRPANSDASGGYAHPYYWAPFVLMGNWL
jgi:CHAT domain-containing protein